MANIDQVNDFDTRVLVSQWRILLIDSTQDYACSVDAILIKVNQRGGAPRRTSSNLDEAQIRAEKWIRSMGCLLLGVRV